MKSSNDLQNDAKRKDYFNNNLIDENGGLNIAKVREDAKKAEEKRAKEVAENRKKYFENERDNDMRDNQLFTGLSDLMERKKEEAVNREIDRKIENKRKEIEETARRRQSLYTHEEEAKRNRLSNLINNVIKEANADD